jgi:hypothetical protein
MQLESFKTFIKKELTNREICEILLSNVITEAIEKELVAYEDLKTHQRVLATEHFKNDRAYRVWWDGWDDPMFTGFADRCLSKLNALYKTWCNPHIAKKGMSEKILGLKFQEREMFAFITKDKGRAWMTSLRPTKGEKGCNSFSIVTVLDKNAPDAKNKKEVKVTVDTPNHKVILETIQLNERTIHVIEI